MEIRAHPGVIEMTQQRRPNVLTMVGFGATVLFGAFVGLFIAGESLDDPGGWAAAGMIAAWLVPLAVLGTLALVRPGRAQPVLVGVTGLAALLVLVQAATGLFPDSWGPVTAVVVYAAGTAVGCLGLHRPRPGAALLLGLVGATIVAMVLSVALHASGVLATGPGVGASTTVLALPFLLIALAYLFGAPVEVEAAERDVTPSSNRSR